MKTKEMNIVEFAKKFANGEFDAKDFNTQVKAGWYDWFCKTESLANKTRYLGKKVLAIMDSKKFDKEKCYVFFKNNCPCVGPLYDDFRICDLKSGDVLWCVQHLEKGSHGSEKAHWEVYGEDFNEPKVNGTWNEVKRFFNEK